MKKYTRFWALTLCVLLISCIIPIGAYALRADETEPRSNAVQPAILAASAGTLIDGLSGAGTENDPVRLGSVSDWAVFAAAVNSTSHFEGVHFELTSDLDFSEYTGNHENLIVSGGTNDKNSFFGGHFNGNGHTISNFKIGNTAKVRVGVFGKISNAVIENLNINGFEVTSTVKTAYVGGIAGMLLDGGKKDCIIQNCTLTGLSVTHDYTGTENFNGAFGGMVGYAMSNLIIRDCKVLDMKLTEKKCGNSRTAVFAGLVGSFYTDNDSSLVIDGCTVTGNIHVVTAGNSQYMFIAGAVGMYNAAKEATHLIKDTTVNLSAVLELNVNRAAAYTGKGNDIFGIGGMVGLVGHTRAQILMLSGCEIAMNLEIRAADGCSVAKNRLGGAVADLFNGSTLIVEESTCSAGDAGQMEWIGYFDPATKRSVIGSVKPVSAQ